MLRTTQFCNKKVMELIHDGQKSVVRSTLNSKIDDSWDPEEKPTRMLNANTLSFLKRFSHRVALSTYGKKYFLYMDTFDGKPISMFIDRKHGNIIYVPLDFSKEVYGGTMLEGEMTRSMKGDWTFYVLDIYLYKKKYLKSINLKERMKLAVELVTNNFTPNPTEDVCAFQIAQYFEYSYIQDLHDTYTMQIGLYCSGLFFKNERRLDRGTLYIFSNDTVSKKYDELRLMNKRNKNANMNTNRIKNKKPARLEPASEPSGEPSSEPSSEPSGDNTEIKVGDNTETEPVKKSFVMKNDRVKKFVNVDKLEVPRIKQKSKPKEFTGNAELRRLWIKKTQKPDVYLLSEKKSPFVKKGLVCIPSIEDSQRIKEWFEGLDTDSDTNEPQILEVECIWNEIFKKYEVIELV